MIRISILIGAGLCAAPIAQEKVDSTFDFQPGDVLLFHSKGDAFPDQTWVVASCRDRDKKYEYSCDMRRIAPTVRNEPFWMTMDTWANATYNDITLLERGRAIPGVAAAGRPVAAPARPVTAPATRPGNEPVGNADAQCTASVPDARRAATFGPGVAKWAIYDNYARRAKEPGISAPIAVGVTFESLTVGQAEPNAVLNDPGRGAYLRNDAAPRGAMLYPVRSVYRVCDRYSDSVKIRRMEARHVCFRDATGIWGCGIDGFPKTTWLQN